MTSTRAGNAVDARIIRVDDRRGISGILHVLKKGCRWGDCPKEYGSNTAIYNRFNRWSRRRLRLRILEALVAQGILVHSTAIEIWWPALLLASASNMRCRASGVLSAAYVGHARGPSTESVLRIQMIVLSALRKALASALTPGTISTPFCEKPGFSGAAEDRARASL